jgi:Cu(I)/Ag(I) efflux system membrane fusion protein
MLLRLQVAGPVTSRLVVPSEAVIRTGKRVVVIVRLQAGAFEPREVSLGADSGDDVEVLQGLNEGDQVVASGQFLIDSEASLRSVLGSMSAPATAQAPKSATPASGAPGAIHKGQGKVEDTEADSITISHGPIASLKWPPMTMGFSKPEPRAFAEIKVGDTVQFEFREGGAMGYELRSMQKLPAGTKP